MPVGHRPRRVRPLDARAPDSTRSAHSRASCHRPITGRLEASKPSGGRRYSSPTVLTDGDAICRCAKCHGIKLRGDRDECGQPKASIADLRSDVPNDPHGQLSLRGQDWRCATKDLRKCPARLAAAEKHGSNRPRSFQRSLVGRDEAGIRCGAPANAPTGAELLQAKRRYVPDAAKPPISAQLRPTRSARAARRHLRSR